MPQRGISALGGFLLAAALRRVANCEVVEGCNRKLNHLKWQAVSTSWRLGWIDLHEMICNPRVDCSGFYGVTAAIRRFECAAWLPSETFSPNCFFLRIIPCPK